MKIPLLHQQIILQTEKLREMHRTIMMHAPPVPVNEIENLIKEIRSLYSLALELNSENSLELLNEMQIALNQKVPLVEVQPLALENNPVLIGNEEENNLPPVQETSSIHSPEILERLKTTRSMNDSHKENNTWADQFEEHQTIGERIARNGQMKRVSDKLKTPVGDIQSIIGLNEKFQFINLLFRGDTGKYNSAIELINTCSNSDEALKKVKEIPESSFWTQQPAVVKTFLEIIERRFAV
jgi:hypothetical protein